MSAAIIELTKERRATELFLAPPAPTRLDCLVSFATFGIDVKITPENHVKVLETEVLEFGMNGFEEAGVLQDGVSPESRLTTHLQTYGLPHNAYIRKGLENMGLDPGDFLLPYFEVPRKTHPEWRKYECFIRALCEIQQLAEDKRIADQFFEDLRDYKPRTRGFDEESLRALKQEENPEYVVVKPRKGLCGLGIIVERADAPFSEIEREVRFEWFLAEALDVSLERVSEFDYVLEPFVPSKPIYCGKTGERHDGCMRYVLLIEEALTGEIFVTHFSGYWRLCPRPIVEYGELDAMRANLFQGAIPQKASPDELGLVRATVNDFMPRYYRNLLNSIRE